MAETRIGANYSHPSVTKSTYMWPNDELANKSSCVTTYIGGRFDGVAPISHRCAARRTSVKKLRATGIGFPLG
jgi:hypothetical protein